MLLANSLGLISFIYVTHIAAFTAICSALEYASYLLNRRQLRVSNPHGKHERVDLLLSLPYRYAVPLIVLSAVLYWTDSQSSFLARVNVYQYHRYPITTGSAGEDMPDFA